MDNRKNVCELLERIPGYCVRVPCERCPLRGRRSEVGSRRKAQKGRIFTYKGYVLIQNPSGNYYIFDRKASHWVVHAQCEGLLSRREAKEHIRFYLNELKDRRNDYRGVKGHGSADAE